MENKPIGRGKFAGQLPKWLVTIEVWMRWKKTRTLASCMQTTRVIFDAWRYWGCGLKNLERKTQELASTYLASLEHPDSFAGVRLRD